MTADARTASGRAATPRVSVIVPVYNGQRFLAEALHSLLSQRQSLQIIVVDDGSTDGTRCIIESFGDALVALHQENRGPAAARNAGIGAARAPLLGFLDADDLWLPTTLDDQLACIDNNPDADVAWGLTERLWTSGGPPERDEWNGGMQWTMTLGSMVFRRSVIDAAGGFDFGLRAGEDYDLLVRLKEEGATIVRHPAPVLRWRQHGGVQLTADRQAMKRAHFQVVAKSLARRRVRVGPKRES
jgi:glycosyltransferase involved in cell wall biosynthesis